MGLPLFKCWGDREGSLDGGPLSLIQEEDWDNCMRFHLSLVRGLWRGLYRSPFFWCCGRVEVSLSGSAFVCIVGIDKVGHWAGASHSLVLRSS